jgi:hypothetical protein
VEAIERNGAIGRIGDNHQRAAMALSDVSSGLSTSTQGSISDEQR